MNVTQSNICNIITRSNVCQGCYQCCKVGCSTTPFSIGLAANALHIILFCILCNPYILPNFVDLYSIFGCLLSVQFNGPPALYLKIALIQCNITIQEASGGIEIHHIDFLI